MIHLFVLAHWNKENGSRVLLENNGSFRRSTIRREMEIEIARAVLRP